MSHDSFDASAKGRTTESGAAVARDEIGMAEAAMALAREFGLSRRQAYRYLELARAGAPATPAAENSVTITVKMPEKLARGLRAHAGKLGVTTSEVVR